MENNRRSLGVLLDCSRDAVYSVPALKTFIGLIAGMGYTSLQLYTEDTYTLENEPYFGRFRGRYSRAELQELDAFAASEGVELVPCIQTLAHLGGALRWPGIRILILRRTYPELRGNHIEPVRAMVPRAPP